MPARPVANANTVSLVEVSLSTVMQLKVLSFEADNSCWRKPASTAASVKIYPSIVAISGAIMPEPLMIPTTCTFVPPTIALAVAPFAKVSVVPMVLVASSQLQGSELNTRVSPANALSLGNGTPMTPVDDTNTALSEHPRCAATCVVIASTASRPR